MNLDPTTLFFIISAILLFILLIVGVVMSSNSERNLVEDRLGRYLNEEKKKQDTGDDSSYLTEWVNRRVEKSSSGGKIKKSLARADLKFKVAEYYALVVIAIVLFSLVVGFLGGGKNPVPFGIGAIVGGILPSVYVGNQQRKRLKNFSNQLPDMINLMVNGLRAGYSTMQAMEAISKELPPPISDEFRRVVQEMQLGIAMERAMENLLRRIPSDDLDFMITAINVQREVGGNLAEILDTISFTIRERIRIKGEIQVLTSQVRMSAKILSFVPIGLAMFLWVFNNEYMQNLFLKGPQCAFGVLGLGLILIGLGYAIMMKIADIEV